MIFAFDYDQGWMVMYLLELLSVFAYWPMSAGPAYSFLHHFLLGLTCPSFAIV
jgi:hypothetical protein